MKKFITAVFATVAMLTATTAQAQIQFGLKGGLNVSSMSLDKEVLDASNRCGFFVGPTVKFTLPVVGLGIDASALYDQREAKISANTSNNTVSNITEETIKQQLMAPTGYASRTRPK